MSHEEFKKHMKSSDRAIGTPDPKGETVKRQSTKANKSRTKGSARNIAKNPGWYNDSREHALAARGIETAMNNRKSGRPKTVEKQPKANPDDPFDQNFNTPKEGDWDKEITGSNLERAYLNELRDEMNNSNELYDEGEISGDELDRRIEVSRLTANYINDNNLSDHELTELMRQSRYAIKDPNKQYFFYYNIGKEWKEPETSYDY